MNYFEQFSKSLNECIYMDAETGHYEADIILKDIAIAASTGSLTTQQVLSLIELWNKVHKWYA